MTALAAMPQAQERFFLGVEKSARGRAWRDRLDARGQARALAIAQRHGVPEMLSRILAGRGIEAERCAGLPRSDGARADAGPRDADRDEGGRFAPCRCRAEGRDGCDFRRLRCRWRDLVGAAGALSAPLRIVADPPYPRPDVRGLWAECRRRARARRARRDAARHRRLRDDIGGAAGGGEETRTRRGRHRSSSMRRRIARCSGPGESEPARRSLRVRPSRRGRPGVHDARRAEPRIAPARLFQRRSARARSARPRSISSRSAPSPMWCR